MVIFSLLFYLVPKYLTLENVDILQGNYIVTTAAVNIQCVSGLMQGAMGTLIEWIWLPSRRGV